MTFNDFIEKYKKQNLIKEQKSDFQGIETIITRAYDEIRIARANMSIDEGTAFTIAYTSMLHAGRALMLVKGYRPNNGYQHKTVVDFAAMVLGDEFKTLTQHFEKMRRKRNLFIYELSISISETEVDNALKSATTFISAIKQIIEKENPQFKFKF
jgi:uncharacterized protein (UPF0332 family)